MKRKERTENLETVHTYTGNFREEKGITLIALVVTIVILLILAGISLNTVLGENGLVTKAKDAKTKMEQAEQNDLTSIEQIANELEETPTESETLVEAFNEKKLHIGDYVEYKPDAGKTYKSETSENGWADQTYTTDTSTTWRVLGMEEDHILLISGSPIKKNMKEDSTNELDKDPYLYMEGAHSFIYGKQILNNICAIYSTDLGTARSMTIEDVNKACGVKVENNTVYLQSDANKANIDTWGVLGKTYQCTASDYTPNSYINGKKKATEGELIQGTGYWYNITSMIDTKIGKTTLGSLLFDKTTSNDNYAKTYWLASPGAYVDSYRAAFGIGNVGSNAGAGNGLFYSYGEWCTNRAAVRPVVSLKSDVTTADVKIITTSVNEEDWSGFTAQWEASGNVNDDDAENNGN